MTDEGEDLRHLRAVTDDLRRRGTARIRPAAQRGGVGSPLQGPEPREQLTPLLAVWSIAAACEDVGRAAREHRLVR